MPQGKLHHGQVEIDSSIVRRLLQLQFPEWAGLSLEPVDSAGTDNRLYRLGEDMVVRLPLIYSAAGQVDKEQKWLPRLAPMLPLSIPVPLAKGEPTAEYPWNWSVYRWLEGEDTTAGRIADMNQAAADLALFVSALGKVTALNNPPPGRGLTLAERDNHTRLAIEALHGTIDTDAATAAWEACLRAPPWNGRPVWTHGDLISPNLLVKAGRLSAVIDFGTLGVGDPACDLVAAWSVFDTESREVFGSTLGVDDATWIRGRGWALSQALMIIPYYQKTNRELVAVAAKMIDQILADQRGRGIEQLPEDRMTI